MSEKNELFPKDNDFANLVKKARRKSLIKNILVSVAASALLFAGLFWLGTFLMSNKIDNEISYDYATQSIRGANVEIGGSLYNYTPFSANVITSSIKYVRGVPVPWENHEKAFSIFGSSRTVQSHSVSGKGKIDDDRMLLYFQGERMIEFYSPDGTEGLFPDDRPLLEEIAEDQVVEIAFSFDADYSLKEIQDTFSDRINWYWVDASSENDNQPIPGNQAYGFLHNRDAQESANGFIQQIKWLQKEEGNFQPEANRLFEALASGGQSEIDATSMQVSGIVVTGTPEELKEFNDSPMIRAAVLGVTADQY